MQEFFNTQRFGPPSPIKVTSPCPGLDRLASGLLTRTERPFRLAFAAPPGPWALKLARVNNSPDHSSTGTRLSIPMVAHGHSSSAACKRTVSGSFHSPSGVLFTFPSRYWYTIGRQRVFSLGEWSPQIHTKFHVLGVTQELIKSRLVFVYRTLTFFGRPFQGRSTNETIFDSSDLIWMSPTTPIIGWV